MFIIEPCQTMWGYDTNQTMGCAMRVPKGSVLLVFEANNLLIRHPILDSDSDDNYETLHLKAIELGRCAEDDELGKDAVFIGVIRIGEDLKSYAVFAREPHTTLVFKITQTFSELNADRIARAFRSTQGS